ncbi:unnamed protein product [Ectocarpus sp. 8 AP-2014]
MTCCLTVTFCNNTLGRLREWCLLFSTNFLNRVSHYIQNERGPHALNWTAPTSFIHSAPLPFQLPRPFQLSAAAVAVVAASLSFLCDLEIEVSSALCSSLASRNVSACS